MVGIPTRKSRSASLKKPEVWGERLTRGRSA
jgi:hypothetical protein